VGLLARKRDLVRQYSRGMQQRLAIGRAMLHDPDLLLFDEPHTGLDQDAAEMLDGLLTDVAARGKTIVMTSHDLSRASALGDRVDVLSKGVIVASVLRDAADSFELARLYREVTHA
jgi:heme exporter protein A